MSDKPRCTHCGDELVFAGSMGAPGIGNVYECKSCCCRMINVGKAWYDPLTDEHSEDCPWIQQPEDTI